MTKDAVLLFSDKSQTVVRKVFSDADSKQYPEPRKKSMKDHDPLSTMIYEYEHASGTIEKLTVIADGLTKIKSSFTVSDVEELFPREGEKMVRMMISGGIVIELGYGEYRSV